MNHGLVKISNTAFVTFPETQICPFGKAQGWCHISYFS